MPVIPLPPASNTGTFGQRAATIPELEVRATPAAFGANVAEELYRGNMALVSGQAALARSEADMWNTAIRGTIREVGEWWQRDQRLEAEARLHELSLGITRDMEGEEASGDGSHRTRVLATFEDRARALQENARTPYQAALLQEGIQRLRFQHERQAIAAEVAGARQARLDQINTIVQAAELEIFRTPGNLDAARERVLASINDANLSPAARSRALQEAESRLVQIAIERHLTSNNPAAAQALLRVDRNVTALGGLGAARAEARISRAVEEAAERARAVQANRDLIEGRSVFDPANQEHRRVVNDAFTNTNGPQQLAAMDANAVVSVASIARRYGMVPTSAISLLQGMLANGTAEQQIFALQSIATIEAARPGAFQHTTLHSTARAEADDFRFMTSGTNGLGLDPATALARILEQRTPAFRERAEARRALLRGPDNPLNRRTEAELADIFANDPRDAWFGRSAVGNPRDAGVMLQTYRAAFEHHFIRTGDEAQALAAARADLRRVYGVTRQSGEGPRIVRRPVEQVYPAVDGSHDWVRLQLQEIIRTETGRTIPLNQIFLEANRATEEALSRGGVQSGHLPPYAFYWQERGANGTLGPPQTIPGRLFVPDLAGAISAASATADRQRADRARAERRGRDRSLGGPDVGRRVPRAATPDIDLSTAFPGASPPADTLMGREREERLRRRRGVVELLGWGARVTAEGGN